MAVSINLVPESSRKKRRASGLSLKGFQLPREVVIGLAGGLIGLLVVVHILLQLIIVVQFVQLHRYRQISRQIEPQKMQVDRVLQELRKLQANLNVIDGISKGRKIFWAPELNEISDSVTRGLWLEKITMDEKQFVLKGSAVSKSGSEMLEVNNFVAKLKASKIFTKDFGKIELGGIKTRKINTTPVADFTLTAEIKR